jgi:hypothetical protein
LGLGAYQTVAQLEAARMQDATNRMIAELQALTGMNVEGLRSSTATNVAAINAANNIDIQRMRDSATRDASDAAKYQAIGTAAGQALSSANWNSSG